MNLLPQLLDCKALRAELGISRGAAEAIMRKLDTIVIEDLRKTYVKREDVLAYLDARTFSKDQVAAQGSSGFRPSPFSIAFSRFRMFSSRRCSASTLGSPIVAAGGSGDCLPRMLLNHLRSQFIGPVYGRGIGSAERRTSRYERFLQDRFCVARFIGVL